MAERKYMNVSYMILEEGDDLIFENASRKSFEKPPYNDLKEIAEECAKYDYDNYDGWERDTEFQNGLTFVLFDNLTEKEVARHLVKMEHEQRFDAE